jgi:D-alanyl-lipoteichoic acid acyltransferase DltB (MBOAT superfamily)
MGWLGVSYVFFRLISAARDKQIGTLPAMRFDAFLSYVLFFPTLTAGPLDRADRFLKDLENGSGLAAQTFFAGGQRIILGMFKKYVLADLLALFALNSVNAVQTDSTLWTWLLLYGYAFRIFFDFAGYSDIAIGLGKWAGFSVPENFNSPYLKPDLTAFWNSWHMSLAGWFRAYYFNPVSRWMRTVKRPKLSMPVLIAVGQISTMVLIGLWHGITVNFFLWGVWHGVGLFVHNRWADRTRAQARKLGEKPRLQRAVSLGTTLLTFHFVALGWVFFTLPDTGLAFEVLGRLFGF